ncbi:SGNH/GDSL hydrolase family protein [Nocardia ninae]|uniref:Lipase n=1 Tax=Nocardia ninae NBRC 108245 TaxID=1210091 RepID=A0A511M5P8_9NOCA|nr:SGNH/GDSL hydrolase family protein [Nocardia ninae]GEM35973.1 lipase [Nocardia ninae NBRC 108245]
MYKRPTFTAILTTLVAGTVAAPVVSAAPPPTYPSYVALGDSYTAGAFLPVVEPRCGRADRNYPRLVAAAIKPGSFTDVSCIGATTKAMTDTQSPTGNPPQFEALKRDTALVTVGIGGNDVPAFEAVFNCAVRGASVPHGSPCKDFYTRNGVDTLAEQVRAVGPKVGAVLDGVHRRSPKAQVLLVGYPVQLPETGNGCWPIVPISDGDVPFLREKTKLLNQVLREQATSHGATFVDTYTSSIGHDMCQAPGTKWLEGPVPTDLAAPIHPNELGAQDQARQIIATLRR